MARIRSILRGSITLAGVGVLFFASATLALPIVDPESVVIAEEEQPTMLLTALPMQGDNLDELVSRSYSHFGELRTVSNDTVETAIQRAATQASLRDVARTFVNVNNNPPSPRRVRPTGDPEEDWAGDNLGVRDLILNSEALGGIARALVDEGEGEPGYRSFGVLGYQVMVGLSGGGNVGVYEFTTNTGLAVAPEQGGARADRSRVSEAQIVLAVLDFLQSPIGIVLLVLGGTVLFIRIAVKVASSLQHARS
jgi:hypothetical protein